MIIENGSVWWSCRRDVLHGKEMKEGRKMQMNIIEEMNIK